MAQVVSTGSENIKKTQRLKRAHANKHGGGERKREGIIKTFEWHALHCQGKYMTLPINQAGEETVCNLKVLKIGCNFATNTKFTDRASA